MKGYSWSREDYLDLLINKYTMEIENWCLGLGREDTDYILTESVADWLPNLYEKDEIIFQYNQGKQTWSTKSCTLFSPIGAISDLFNLEIPLKVIKIWDTDSYSNWRMPNSWWYVKSGVDHICKEWNNSEYWKKYGKVAYYYIDMRDNELVKKVLDKKYTICTWYAGNATYNNDKNKDWYLDGTEFGKTTYWHAINVIWGITTPCRVKDNYFETTKYNVYGVRHNFSEIPCWYTWGYVITKVQEDNLEEIKRLNEFKSGLLTAIEHNSLLRHLTNDENYKSILHYTNEKHRKKVEDCENELRKYM